MQQVQLCDNRVLNEGSKGILDHATYLREFRTIGLLLPRRSGKTTTLISIYKNYSSILFSKYKTSRHDRVLEDFDYETIYSGKSGSGSKYRFILLDEYSRVPDKVYSFCDFMIRNSFMESDPIIIALATP